MSIKYGTTKPSINEEMVALRREHNSNVSRSLRKWREEHPNPFRDVYSSHHFPLKK